VEDDRFLKISLAIIVLFVAGLVLKIARPVLFPFALAVFVSYVLDPVVGVLMKLKIPKTAAVTLVLLTSFILFYLLGLAVYSSGKAFAGELPKYADRIKTLAQSLQGGPDGVPLRLRVSSYLEKIEISGIASFILATLGPVVRLLSRLFVLFLFVVFIMAGRGRAMGKVRSALKPEPASRVAAVLVTINSQVRKYLVIKTMLGLANGAAVWLVLTLFGVDFALIFGFLAFLLNYIPNFGSIIAGVLRVAFAFFQFGTIWVPLWILIITGGADMIVGNFLEPRMMGKGLGLSPLVVLFSLLFWGWLWGVPGMIIAVPLVATIKIACQNVPSLRPIAILMS